MPPAQTSITSAYANGAQATYELRWDTDAVTLTQMHADIFICASSVLIPVHLWLFDTDATDLHKLSYQFILHLLWQRFR